MLQHGWLDGGVVREKTFVAKFARHATHEREVRRHEKLPTHTATHAAAERTTADPSLCSHHSQWFNPLLMQSLPFLLTVVTPPPPLLVQSLPFLLKVVHPPYWCSACPSS